jgi:DNA modification methylase
MIQAAGLSFFWPLAVVHPGHNSRMSYFGIIVRWKPLLWFIKGGSRLGDDLYKFVDDLIESRREKDVHPWQQGIQPAQRYIETLTNLGDLVFDPFCGGGTTAVAALQLSRRWLTCDIDEQSVHLSRQRIRQAREAVA